MDPKDADRTAITVGAISKTTSVLKLSQDHSAKNIKCQIKIKIEIFSFKVIHFQKNKHNTPYKTVPHSSAITWSLNRDLKLLLMSYIVKSVSQNGE